MKTAQEIKQKNAQAMFSACLSGIRELVTECPGSYYASATRETAEAYVLEIQRISVLLASAWDCLPSDGSSLVEVDVIATTAEAAE